MSDTGKKISDLSAITQAAIQTGMEFEIEQENISYRVSFAQVIEFLKTYFMVATKENGLMPKSGGAFTGTVTAKDENPTVTFATRNIKAVATDPGAGSALATGRVLIVYDE